jgi:hypothetical protein
VLLGSACNEVSIDASSITHLLSNKGLQLYFDHVHLIIFNLVFIDFIWLAPRTFYICSHIFSVFYWSEYLYRLTSFYREVHAENYNAQVDQDRSSSNLHSIKSYANHKFTAEELEGLGVNVARIVPAPEASDAERVKQINYKKTYFEIELNRPLMRMLTPWNSHWRVQSSITVSLCRYLSFLPWSQSEHLPANHRDLPVRQSTIGLAHLFFI